MEMFAGAQHGIDEEAGELLGCDTRGIGYGWPLGRGMERLGEYVGHWDTTCKALAAGTQYGKVEAIRRSLGHDVRF